MHHKKYDSFVYAAYWYTVIIKGFSVFSEYQHFQINALVKCLTVWFSESLNSFGLIPGLSGNNEMESLWVCRFSCSSTWKRFILIISINIIIVKTKSVYIIYK